MSQRALVDFLEAASRDRILGEGLVRAVGGRKGAAAREAVVRYAGAKGYGIAAEDVALVQKAFSELSEREGGLPDADLKAVSDRIAVRTSATELLRTVKNCRTDFRMN